MTDQQHAGTAADDERLERLAAEVADPAFVLPDTAVVREGEGDEPGRGYLARYLSPDELDAAARRGRGRPRLAGSGTGRSPKRQVRLPEDVDDALVRLAHAQGRSPSALMREAITEYVRTA
ncbi:ribbon-helix-helix domain-containing protein [Cellulomonas sp. Y8]|uniref:ribbon-helix-helix domain-containing protein n=1 Tax=Cellulomonas sp. Y8 TaxID=2591145 RepID=UPI003D71E486